MKKINILIVVFGTVLFWSSLVQGASSLKGIAFSQAEEGTWYCLGEKAETALNCAVKKCKAKAGGQECVKSRWCANAGWSGLMTVFLSGFHTTEILCGAPSEQALRSALDLFCAGNKYATKCSIFLTVDPTGKEHQIL